jgi:hypothetical protein
MMSDDDNTATSVGRIGTMANGLEPLAVSPKTAAALLDCGLTRIYGLMKAGELDHYLEGSFRKITMASIRRRHERQLAEAHAGAHKGKSGPGGRAFWGNRWNGAKAAEPAADGGASGAASTKGAL